MSDEQEGDNAVLQIKERVSSAAAKLGLGERQGLILYGLTVALGLDYQDFLRDLDNGKANAELYISDWVELADIACAVDKALDETTTAAPEEDTP